LTIGAVVAVYSEIETDQRVFSPIKNSSRDAMMLGKTYPLPFVRWSLTKTHDGVLFKPFEHRDLVHDPATISIERGQQRPTLVNLPAKPTSVGTSASLQRGQ
jgi:hypothetical protein